jgi:hypothetical protein
MPQCPISDQVQEVMRRIPTGFLPLTNRLVDLETLERYARLQTINTSPGEDGHPREFCKHGPTELLELHWKGINAYFKRGTTIRQGARVGWGDSWLHPKTVIGPAHARFLTNRLHLYQVFSPSLHCRLAS